MRSPLLRAAILITALLAGTPAVSATPEKLDLVIEGGRVIDPESGLDAVRNVGVRQGKIVVISQDRLAGARTIKAQGLVVAPGFIDLHAHGQELPAARMQAFDGVTTALELEQGMLPTDQFYAAIAREGRPINYGASASWTQARQEVMDGAAPVATFEALVKSSALPNWSSKVATPDQVEAIKRIVDQALDQGALGIGLAIGYAPATGRKEYYEMNRLAAARGVPTFTHVRFASVTEPHSSFEAYQEMVAVAASTGAHMHVCHLNSTSLRDAPKVIEMIGAAQKRGVPLTVEAYPYDAGSTEIGAPMFRGPDWRERMGGVTAADASYDGKVLDEESFAAMQKNDPTALIVLHYLEPGKIAGDQEILDASVLYPGGAIASDGVPWTFNGKPVRGDEWPLPQGAQAHPRSAGTFSRILGVYVRERRLISLPEAIRKMTLIPAQVLEEAVPQMRDKGRLRLGADADIVVFDPATVADRATYERPAQTSVGMRWVIVNGVLVISDGKLDLKALPGRPIRRNRSSAPG